MEKLEQIEYNGYKINIYQDENDFNDTPGDWGNNDCFLVHYHRDCWIENKQVEEDDIAQWYRGNKSLEKKWWVFPVAAYIHSGVVLSLGSGRHFPDYNWDVSHVGALLVERKRGLRETKAHKWAEGLIETWNDYLSGNIYGYMIEDYKGNEEGGIWGFYGDYEKSGLIDEAKAEIDDMVLEQQEINKNLQPVEIY